MRPAFHEQSTVFSVADGALAGGSAEGLFEAIDTSFAPSPDAAAAIVRVDIVGSAASARIDTDNLSGSLTSSTFLRSMASGRS